MQNTAGLCWALSHETKASDRKALLHLAVRILTLPPIVIGVTLLLMYAPAGLLTRRGAAAVRGVPAGYPIGGVPAAGDLPHWKGPTQGAARHGAGMQRRWVSVRVSLVNADTMLMARPYPVSLLCHFHRSAVAAQRGFGLRASGHACSTTAPAFLLTWKLHPLFVIPSVLLIAAVYRSSLKLSRHTLPQLLAGSAVSLLACVISIVVYGVDKMILRRIAVK